MKSIVRVLAVAALVYAGSKSPSRANGGGSYGGGGGSTAAPRVDSSQYEKAQKVQALYQHGVEAGKEGDYEKAKRFFEDALKEDPDNADVLNMLAHAQRKTDLIDEAIENYWKALKIRPNFPEAREYLGEAYLQAALKETDTLKSYGKDGEEQLEDLTAAFKDAAEKLKDSK